MYVDKEKFEMIQGLCRAIKRQEKKNMRKMGFLNRIKYRFDKFLDSEKIPNFLKYIILGVSGIALAGGLVTFGLYLSTIITGLGSVSAVLASWPASLIACIPLLLPAIGLWTENIIYHKREDHYNDGNLRFHGRSSLRFVKGQLAENYEFHLVEMFLQSLQKEILKKGKQVNLESRRTQELLNEKIKLIRDDGYHIGKNTELKTIINDINDKYYEKIENLYSKVNENNYEKIDRKIKRIIKKGERAVKPWCDLYNEYATISKNILKVADKIDSKREYFEWYHEPSQVKFAYEDELEDKYDKLKQSTKNTKGFVINLSSEEKELLSLQRKNIVENKSNKKLDEEKTLEENLTL